MKRLLTAISVIMILVIFGAMPVLAANKEDASGEAPGNSVTSPSGNALSPNVVVSKYSCGGDTVTAGKTFTLTYTLYNTNKNLSIQNVVVKTNGGDQFALSKDSNTYYAEKVGAKGAIEHKSEFISSVETAPGSYPISFVVNFDYFDSGQKYSGTSEVSITIPVIQEERLTIINASMGSEGEPIIMDEEYNVEYDFLNAGFAKILNTRISLYNADTNEMVSTAYLGTVNPSTQMTGSSYLAATFGSTGSKNMKFVVSYEDQHANVHTTEQLFAVNVEESAPVVDENQSGEAEQSNFLLWGILVIVVLIIGGVVLVVILRKKRKKTKDEELFWDDDEDEDDGSDNPENTTDNEISDNVGDDKNENN